MSLRFFMIPVNDSGELAQELNAFLAGHKVVSVERKLIDQGSNSFWAISVDYLTSQPSATARNTNLMRSRIDYKTVLPADEFAIFSQLHQLRKEIAQTEAVPVYALAMLACEGWAAPARAPQERRTIALNIFDLDLRNENVGWQGG